jgi:hypothetical protein
MLFNSVTGTLCEVGYASCEMRFLEGNTLSMDGRGSVCGHRFSLRDVVPLGLLDGEGHADDGTMGRCVLQSADLVAMFACVEGGCEHPQSGGVIALQEGADLLALAEERFHRSTGFNRLRKQGFLCAIGPTFFGLLDLVTCGAGARESISLHGKISRRHTQKPSLGAHARGRQSKI